VKEKEGKEKKNQQLIVSKLGKGIIMYKLKGGVHVACLFIFLIFKPLLIFFFNLF
jgi:hypothetical protein